MKNIPMFDPAHPGEVLRDIIEGIREESQQAFTIETIAQWMGTTRKTLSALLNTRQSVSPEMALRLERAFPNTTAEFWLGMQEQYDLAQARRTVQLDNIRPLWPPQALAS